MGKDSNQLDRVQLTAIQFLYGRKFEISDNCFRTRSRIVTNHPGLWELKTSNFPMRLARTVLFKAAMPCLSLDMCSNVLSLMTYIIIYNIYFHWPFLVLFESLFHNADNEAIIQII